MFNRACLVVSGFTLRVVGLIRARPGVHSVHSGALMGSLGSFGRPVGVAGFTRVRWVRSGGPWGGRINLA